MVVEAGAGMGVSRPGRHSPRSRGSRGPRPATDMVAWPPPSTADHKRNH